MARQGGQVQLVQTYMRLALKMARMAKGGFLRTAREETKHLIKKPCTKVWEQKKRGDEHPGHTKVIAAIERHPAMVYENQTDACLAKMALQRIQGKVGGAKEQVHLVKSDANSRHQNKCHLHLERHLRQPVKIMALKVLQLQICLPDMYLNLHLSPALNFSIMMHLPKIVSTMKILFQICGLMKQHPLVSTVSAAWQYSWHPFCRWQQLIRWNCKWTRTWIVRNVNVECSIIYYYWTLYSMFQGIYLYVLSKNNVVI